jgi:ketosteroid isomerase-like protein
LQTPYGSLAVVDGQRETRKVDVDLAIGRTVFADGVRHGDLTAIASVYSDAAKLLAPSAELIEGRGAIRAFWKAGLDAGVVDIELEAATVERRDRLAYELGRYVLRLRPAPGRTILDQGRYLVVLEQVADGTWRRAVEMFNPEAPSALPAGVRPGRSGNNKEACSA